MATRTKASKNDHITTLLFVLSLTARWIRSRTSMYSCSCLAPENIKLGFDFKGKYQMGLVSTVKFRETNLLFLNTKEWTLGKELI